MWRQLDFQLNYTHVASMLCSLQRCDGRAVQGVWLKRLSLPAKRVFSSGYPGVGSNPTRTTFYGSLLGFHPYVNASSGRNRSWIICCRLLVFTSNCVHLTCVSVVIYLQGWLTTFCSLSTSTYSSCWASSRPTDTTPTTAATTVLKSTDTSLRVQ